MSPTRILFLSLLATGCAATSGPSTPAAPAPETLRSYESAAAPSIAAEPAPERAVSTDELTFRLTDLPPQPAPAPFQDPGAPAAGPPASPHSFSGGVGIRFRDGDSALDLLAQYHYYVNPKLDIGAIVDWAFSPIDTLLIAPAAWWHANERLTVFGAPGLEFESGDGSEFALRLGASYMLMLEKLAIRPFGWYDFVTGRDDAFAIGVAIGI